VADERPIIIIKRIKKVAGGHHGGAWKVAYADFVTAMMAFFLLLWLLNAVTEEQKKGIASYFRPTLAVQNTSASFTILAGQAQPMESMSGGASAQTDLDDPEQADMTQEEPATGEGKQPDSVKDQPPDPGEGAKPVDLAEAAATVAAAEQKQFEQIKNDIKNAIQESPELMELEKNLKIDQTEDGIRIQLLDQEKSSMFPSGSAAMNPRSKELLAKVAEVVRSLPNRIEISGHTDATPYAGGRDYTNWELSADRANASRRVLVGAGISPDRLQKIEGRADTDPFVASDPFDPENRRISIILLRQPPPPSPAPAPDPAPDPNANAGPPAELVP
jgi:chemotaxis protein MotB